MGQAATGLLGPHRVGGTKGPSKQRCLGVRCSGKPKPERRRVDPRRGLQRTTHENSSSAILRGTTISSPPVSPRLALLSGSLGAPISRCRRRHGYAPSHICQRALTSRASRNPLRLCGKSSLAPAAGRGFFLPGTDARAAAFLPRPIVQRTIRATRNPAMPARRGIAPGDGDPDNNSGGHEIDTPSPKARGACRHDRSDG